MLAYAVRHGESLHNIKKSPSLNSSLSPLGRQQALAVARRFGNLAISAIYSSPFTRCIETAQRLAERLRIPIWIHPELFEFHNLPPGTEADMELHPIEDICRRHAGTRPCPDFAGEYDWPAPDEPIETMIARVKSFSSSLKNRWTGHEDTVVLISHGSPIARLIEAWLVGTPGPSFRFTIDNATIAALRHHEDVSSLVCLNETSHLRELPVCARANFREDGSIKPQPASSYW